MRRPGGREGTSREGTSRGQSETLGFVFIFALITLSIAVTFTVGVAGLDDARQTEQVNNVERAFDVLEDNVEDVTRRGATSRATEIRLADGSLRLGEPVAFTVEARNASNASQNTTFTTSARPIVYEAADGTEIVYVNGAVIRDDRNAFVLSDPDWLVSDRQTVIPLVATYGTLSAGGGGKTVLVVTELQSRTVPGQLVTSADGTHVAEVNVTVESPRAEAWDRYFDQEGFERVDGDSNDGNVTYSFETDAVYAPQASVEVDLVD